ncbi:DUSP11 [Bugula neritina]|uniref:DUSP11 n=1 Tax=Bugula neritina TaxID=10212 RepID=A0A7J7JTA6_BUGNE|nr:DUSP11 [Bugula neritina]
MLFAQEVKKFLKVPENRNAVVGVHCTHGLNRTGYLICKYLIEHENMDPEEAINLFNVCRGHDMERENYLAHLCNGTL